MKKKAKRKKYRKCKVLVSVIVDMELSESLVPDDEWREQFYDNITNFESLAEHVAYNIVMNGISDIRQLDGFADRRGDELGDIDTNVEVEFRGDA